MFLKRVFIILVCMLTIIVLTGCGAAPDLQKGPSPVAAKSAASPDGGTAQTTHEDVTFTDDTGRQVTVKKDAKRVGIASGSFAECWILAGGTPVAVTQDAFEERELNLPEDITDLGSLQNPSLETILAADLDFLVLSANLKGHLALAETLDNAGIPYAYVDIETFDDYLKTLKNFTDITGRPDLYQKNGVDVGSEIDKIISSNKRGDEPKILILRTSPSNIKARNSQTMVGGMLKDLGVVNIADTQSALLEDLSLEVIADQNPEYIFIVCQGDAEEAKANLETLIASNPIWATLDAVKNDRVYYLPKELFHYKPNDRWAQSYEMLAEILGQG